MSLETRGPKEHIENVRDRFMDYVGNSHNGLLGDYDNLTEEGISDEQKARISERIKIESWPRFFQTIETFLKSDFEPTGNITRENLEKVLERRNDDPFEVGVIANVDRLYCSIVGVH